MRTLFVSLAVAATFGATAARADCASDADIAAYVADYLAKTPTKILGVGGTMDDALCTQAKLVKALEPHLGPVIGHKAGLTSKPAQERFKAKEPVRGVLFRDMILEDGATVPKKFGTLPLLEADLLLIVGDAAINDAKTPEEAIRHISAVRPFIELPDLTVAKGEPINAVTLTAIGVAPRLGVAGAPIPVKDGAAMLNALASMKVMVKNAAGDVMIEAPGKAVLGNPVNSVLWLRSKGVTFKKGDLVSVGSIGPLMPAAKAGAGATVTYAGLPGDPSVSVVFE